MLAWRLQEYGVVESTQDLAEAVARKGGAEGTVVFAEAQTKGRGRAGRRWLSPGGGLYFSLIVRPNRSEGIHLITLLAALAIAEGIRTTTDVKTQIRWPNDIFTGGKKLGGVIASGSERGGSMEYVVVGMGINCNFRAAELGEFSSSSTTLMDILRRPIELASLRSQILETFAGHYESWRRREMEVMMRQIRSLLSTANKKVEYKPLTGEAVSGVAEKLADDGTLVVRREGKWLRLRAEETEWLREL